MNKVVGKQKSELIIKLFNDLYKDDDKINFNYLNLFLIVFISLFYLKIADIIIININ